MTTRYYDEDYDHPSLYSDEVEHAKDHLIGLVKSIYTTGDIKDLEWHLEEILGVFNMDIPKRAPLLETTSTKIEKSTERDLQAWVGYTRAYAEMLTNKQAKL